MFKRAIAAALTLITSLSINISEARSKKPFNAVAMNQLEVESIDSGGTLIFSDSPEYVSEDGILYTDIVEGDARVLFYHLNDSRINKRIAVIVENVAERFNTVDIIRGAISEPSDNFLKVGKSVQTDYMSKPFHSSIYLLKNDRKHFWDGISNYVLKPGQLIYGVYDFNAAHPIRISILMYPKNAEPLDFLKTAKILPKDEHRLRGTFRNMNRVINVKKIYDPAEGASYIKLADNVNDLYKFGVDATDGSEVLNYGNYGVNYTINLETKGNLPTRICLTPLGGYYAGAVKAVYNGESKLFLTPDNQLYFGVKKYTLPEKFKKLRAEGNVLLTNQTELAELGTYSGKVSLEFSPPGASNLPVNIILMPTDNIDIYN